MAKFQHKVYVTAYFGTSGKFRNFSILDYKPAGEMNEYGMSVLLREETLEFDVPDDMNEVNILAAASLEAFITKEKGAHQMKMMQLQAALNAMRGIGYTEVLDRPEDSRPRVPFSKGDVDDAIAF